MRSLRWLSHALPRASSTLPFPAFHPVVFSLAHLPEGLLPEPLPPPPPPQAAYRQIPFVPTTALSSLTSQLNAAMNRGDVLPDEDLAGILARLNHRLHFLTVLQVYDIHRAYFQEHAPGPATTAAFLRAFSCLEDAPRYLECLQHCREDPPDPATLLATLVVVARCGNVLDATRRMVCGIDQGAYAVEAAGVYVQELGAMGATFLAVLEAVHAWTDRGIIMPDSFWAAVLGAAYRTGTADEVATTAGWIGAQGIDSLPIHVERLVQETWRNGAVSLQELESVATTIVDTARGTVRPTRPIDYDAERLLQRLYLRVLDALASRRNHEQFAAVVAAAQANRYVEFNADFHCLVVKCFATAGEVETVLAYLRQLRAAEGEWVGFYCICLYEALTVRWPHMGGEFGKSLQRLLETCDTEWASKVSQNHHFVASKVGYHVRRRTKTVLWPDKWLRIVGCDAEDLTSARVRITKPGSAVTKALEGMYAQGTAPPEATLVRLVRHFLMVNDESTAMACVEMARRCHHSTTRINLEWVKHWARTFHPEVSTRTKKYLDSGVDDRSRIAVASALASNYPEMAAEVLAMVGEVAGRNRLAWLQTKCRVCVTLGQETELVGLVEQEMERHQTTPYYFNPVFARKVRNLAVWARRRDMSEAAVALEAFGEYVASDLKGDRGRGHALMAEVEQLVEAWAGNA